MNNRFLNNETIVAQATAIGMAGVGIIRVSGPNAIAIAKVILKQELKPRYATYLPFYKGNEIIDYGIAIYFKNPHSFTGEDVVEFQGHGGQVILQHLISTIIETGLVRLAKPGEFSQQAFINGKIDIVQAEAIADLIEATNLQSAKAALNSLSGGFSNEINNLLDRLIDIRMFVEASIDFPDEDLEFIGKAKIADKLIEIHKQIDNVYQSIKQGVVLRDGLTAVIVGEPNAGKSSILNELSQQDTAIVSDIAGTTRDAIKEYIHIDGMPLLVVDTAGLRVTNDQIEKIGIERSYDAMRKANFLILVCCEGSFKEELLNDLPLEITSLPKVYIYNKFDLVTEEREAKYLKDEDSNYHIDLSVITKVGIVELRNSLRELIQSNQGNESTILARKRHVLAFEETQFNLINAIERLNNGFELELCAEDLRLAQQSLGQITGRFSQDDLLGTIFTNFCIGK